MLECYSARLWISNVIRRASIPQESSCGDGRHRLSGRAKLDCRFPATRIILRSTVIFVETNRENSKCPYQDE